jgi:cell division protein FtsB
MIEQEKLEAVRRSSKRSGLVSGVGFLFVVAAIGYGVWQTMQLSQTIDRKKAELNELQNKASDSRKEIATLEQQKQLVLTQIQTIEKNVQEHEPANHASRIFGDIARKVPSPVAQQTIATLTPLFAVVKPRASAEPLGTKNSAGQAESQYSVWIDVPADRASEIRSVSYEFNHPTFTDKIQTSSDASNGFRVGYQGWGCLALVAITLNLTDGTTQPISFDQCAGLRADVKRQ